MKDMRMPCCVGRYFAFHNTTDSDHYYCSTYTFMNMLGIMKLWEVLDTHVEVYNDTFGYTPVTHLFNRRKFKSLPEEVQQLFVNYFEPATIGVTEFEESNVPFYQKASRALHGRLFGFGIIHRRICIGAPIMAHSTKWAWGYRPG